MILKMENSEIDSPIEVLYGYYAERYPINNEKIWERYGAMQRLLLELPQAQMEEITNAVSLLIAEHEQEAFTRGIQTGIRLVQELGGSEC